MRRESRFCFPLIFILLCLSTYLHAQQWSGILDPSRAIDWSANNAGVVGGIPATRTSVCSTLNPGATAAQINSAISSCSSGQVVKLNAGTYNLSSGLVFNSKSNVTLLGDGPDQTFLKFTGTNSCDGHSADVCVFGFSGCEDCSNPNGGQTNWTAGYTQGTNTITVQSSSGMAVGMILLLSQANDSSDTGGIWVNDALHVASIEGSCGPDVGPQNGHCQTQLVRVGKINGNQITISPGLYETNWRAGQTPRVWWTGTAPSTGVGIEDLSIDNSSASAYSIVSFHNTTNSWVKNIRTVNGTRNHIGFWIATHIEVRDSYMYGTQNAASQSYGTEPEFASDLLIINNIFQRITSPAMMGNNAGSIYAYNFGINNYYTQVLTFMQTSYFGSHDAGTHMMLFEGNDGAQALWDTYHGAGGNQTTFFRTYLTGWEAGKTSGTTPVAIWANNRANNMIGNVLGRAGFHTTYDPGGGCFNCIYSLGEAAWAGDNYNGVNLDPKVASSLMRWGNYDTVTGTVRFLASEVPTTGITFVNGNPVPASQTLPASFFLSAKPNWWPAAKPWPAIGPDVTGGNISGVGGHVYSIPARDCYANVMGGAADGSGSVLSFNANNCYVANKAPDPPDGLKAIVN